MRSLPARWPSVLALLGALLGLAFAGVSTLDYVQHLDRQVHNMSCSFVPGLTAAAGADTACRAAMYSPYAALFRDRFWGGLPISLFAVGAFAFLAAFALYLLVARERAARRAAQFFALVGWTPLAASLFMAGIAIFKLGHVCKTCAGIYASSLVLAVGAIGAWITDRRSGQLVRTAPPPPKVAAPLDAAAKVEAAEAAAAATAVAPTVVDAPDDDTTITAAQSKAAVPAGLRRTGSLLLLPAWLAGLGAFTAAPALVYWQDLPDYKNHVGSCGTLPKPSAASKDVLHLTSPRAVVPATLIVDPLCPTCKALHQRLAAEGILPALDAALVLFPLDSECNWNLRQPMHPGSCIVSKAIVCGEQRSQHLQVLEWAYESQDDLLEAAKAGAGLVNVRAMVKRRFPDLDACIDDKATERRLDRMMHFAVDNKLPVSTPQLFVADQRVCDEDTDLGLAYTLRLLAPQLRSP
ncbi:MAG: hypothetical protein HY908_28340 [Myxococcales bacterium]|nr:hypothetical protein [Myxococcales bacterium]